MEERSAPDLIGHAAAIGDALLRNAQRPEDGSITWGRGYDRDFGKAADCGIFNGRIGEALFFAALSQATGCEKYRDAALSAVKVVCSTAGNLEASTDLLLRTGYGLTGVGSVIYTLVAMGDILDDSGLIQAAALLSRVLTPQAIRSDHKFELFWGTAGALLGLLALESRDADARVRAQACADHLVASRITDEESGKRAWPTDAYGSGASVGFAHGSSGIAFALLAASARLGDRRWYDAAIEAFEFERSVFDPEKNQWPDVRRQTTPVLSSWCHGAPGVALSRLAALPILNRVHESEIASDLLRALERTARQPLGPTDNLCCGNLGRAEILSEAATRLGNQSLALHAKEIVVKVITRSGGKEFRWPAYEQDEGHMRAGFWQGAAGIGYALLRQAYPQRYPFALALS